MAVTVARVFRVAVLGASGYTGADLVRLLAPRRDVEIVALTAERHSGAEMAEVHPQFAGLALPRLTSLAQIDWRAISPDVVFCALPHAASAEAVQMLVDALDHPLRHGRRAPDSMKGEAARIIDLSADFRLRDPQTYASWYGRAHPATELLGEAVYGLSEWNRDRISRAWLVACPGCYPTAALLALLPFAAAKPRPLIDPDSIIIDAKSGVSGAGRGLKPEMLFSEVAESLRPYGVGRHRHMPEIEQELAGAVGAPVTVSFTPHLVPMNRGELVTAYVRCADGVDAADLKQALMERYEGEPFIHVPADEHIPATRDVRGSNRAVINVFPDRRRGHAIVIAAIDNLVKGSSGQAIQNMNLMLGLEETEGLSACPMFP